MPKTYSTVQGDTWDIIAKRQLGSEAFTSELIGINYQHQNTVIFSAGVVLKIPEITQSQKNDANLPPWRRNR